MKGCVFMNLKSGHIQCYESYSQFTSLKEFNTHMEQWLLDYKQEFTKGERVGLKRLVRFAAKIPGVCHAKIGTILKVINEEYKDNGISRSTFKRMVSKAKKIGLLSVYETERKNGSQSSNLYVFNRFPKNELPETEKLNHLNKTNNLPETNQKEIKKRNNHTPHDKQSANINSDNPTEYCKPSLSQEFVLDYTYVHGRIPQEFVQFVKCFFTDAKTIEEYWRMTRIAAFKFDLQHEHEIILDIAIKSFKQLIGKLKSTSKIKKPIPYYYGILMNKLMDVYEEVHVQNQLKHTPLPYILKNDEVVFYDWLSEKM